jgi:hypothetical protein
VGQRAVKRELRRKEPDGCVNKLVLDVSWAARPVALARKQGRTTLVLEDPGGVPLDSLLGARLELTRAPRAGPSQLLRHSGGFTIGALPTWI